VRYLNKRQKQSGAGKVLRKYYGTVNGKRTIVYTSPLTGKRVGLVRSIGRKSLYRMGHTNSEVDRQENPCAIYSAATGRSPWQREETKALQNCKCAECGAELAQVHHKSGLANKTNPLAAGYAMQKTGLCHAMPVTSGGHSNKSNNEAQDNSESRIPLKWSVRLGEHGGKTYSL
jgi:hypothetical protein